MPLLRFDLIEGRTEQEITLLLDAAHAAVLEAFHVPPQDRYQVVNEHKKSHIRIEDTGLGIPRTEKALILQVTSRPRTEEQKQTFYRILCQKLSATCGLAASDIVISFVENTDADWSFGNGEAQFLTGKL